MRLHTSSVMARSKSHRSSLLMLAILSCMATCSLAFLGPARLLPLRTAPALSRSTGPYRIALAPTPIAKRANIGLRMTTSTPEKFEFQAEVSRVMDIIINSLYSEKDVFLRELVSNAADACDKKRFLSLSKEAGSDALEIMIKADKDAKTLTIQDSGVGMTKDELINNLGRIAKSGTKAFQEAMKDKGTKTSGENALSLIGQFGVGFYSGFLVADKLTVVTKGLEGDGKVYQWESEAGQSFTIAEADDSEISGASGTKIVLQLREDAEEYMDDFKIKQLIARYSEFINFPIKIWTERTTYEQVPDDEANKDLPEGGKPKMKSVPVVSQEWELQNTQKPLWMRPPSKVTAEQYSEFYKSTFKAYDDPLTLSHFSLEGQVEFRALLYVPSQLPFELASNMFDPDAKSLRLYVKRVFINDNFAELCPRWLKFVKGVVDSEDLPLNVGREILQKSSILRVVSRRIVKKALDMFDDLKKKGGEDWTTFQKNFDKYLKVGVIEDNENRKDIASYISFQTSLSKNMSTFDDYISRKKEDQKCIYFVSGDGRAQCEIAPAMEKVTAAGFEVMFCTEALDELCMMEVKEFEGLEIVDIAKTEVKGIDDKEEEKKAKEEKKIAFDATIKFLADTLGKDKVEKVEVSTNLGSSPACLAQGQYGMSPQMQKYMKARAVTSGDDMMGMVGGTPSVLQINPDNQIVQNLQAKLASSEGKGGDDEKKMAQLIYNVAALRGGYEIQNPAEFASLVSDLMAKS